MMGAECVKLERPFPELLLRITHNGAVVDEKRFDGDAEQMSLVANCSDSGTDTAQLYAVFRFGRIPGETLVPISNAAEKSVE